MEHNEEFDEYFHEQRRIDADVLSAINALTESGVRTAEYMHLNCLRSDGTGNVCRLQVTADRVVEYIQRVSEIAKRNRELKRPKLNLEKDEIFADLRFLRIDGDLNIVTDTPVLLDYSHVLGRLHVSASNLCGRFDANHATLGALDIDLGRLVKSNTRKFNLSLVETFCESVSVTSNSDATRSLYANLTKAQIGRLSAVDLRIRNIRADSASFRESVRIVACGVNVARFSRCSFTDGWKFFDCTFFKAPNFTDAKMDRQFTAFTDCRFQAAGRLVGAECTPDDVANYRYLRGHFSRAKDFHHENLFYCLEQRGHRILSESSLFDRLLSFAYDALGDYGNSVGRPLGIFVIQIMFFSGLFWFFGGAVGKGVLLDYSAIGLSLQNSFNPIGLFSEKSLVSINSVTMYGLSLLQAIFSVVLIALMLIGIRSRFKKSGGESS